jgi:outer membrane protein W
MRDFIRGAFAAIAMGAAAVSAAQAADLPSVKAPPPPPAFVDTYQPFQVRLKVGGVIPTEGTSTFYDRGIYNPVVGALLGNPAVGPATGLSAGPGGVLLGASTSISSSVIPMLDVAYFLTKNWAIEAICCVTPHHIQGTGTLAGGSVAHTWLFPPSVMLQYHFTNFGAIQPYLGVGVNFTTFWGTRAGNNSFFLPFVPGSQLAALNGATTNLYSVSITPSWGVVGQAGVDYMFNEHWGVNVDVKYITMQPRAHAWGTAFVGAAPAANPIFVPVNVAVNINPIIVSAGLTYRFGGDWGLPKILPH